jgi:MFS family permease
MLGLLGMVVLVGMGERMAERYLPLYLVALGGGALAIGALSGMQNLLNALYSYPGGYLAERLGTRRALLVFNLLAIAGFVAAILAPSWPAVIGAAALFLAWSAVSLPATMALVARVLPADKRTMGVTMHSLVRRVPMALGPLLGGALIGLWGVRDGMRCAFGVAIVMAALGIVVQQRLIAPDAPLGARPPRNPLRLWRELNPSLRGLLASDILIRFCEQIPYAFVVIWCTSTIARPVSAFQFGVLTAIEMGVAMLLYVPVAALADRGEKQGFVLLTFVFFTAFPVVLWFSRSFGWLVLAFVLRGLKEFGEPTRKALILDLAPAGRQASAFGLYYLVRDVIVSVAAFGGAFLWQAHPAWNLFAASGFGVAGTLWFALTGRSTRASEPARDAR